jgi:hypothetical protein
MTYRAVGEWLPPLQSQFPHSQDLPDSVTVASTSQPRANQGPNLLRLSHASILIINMSSLGIQGDPDIRRFQFGLNRVALSVLVFSVAS